MKKFPTRAAPECGSLNAVSIHSAKYMESNNAIVNIVATGAARVIVSKKEIA